MDKPTFESLAVGLSLDFSYHFSEQRVEAFAALVDDFAPVHFDENFSVSQGFPSRIVHGLFIQAALSGSLGCRLPGPYSVINTLSMKMHRPVLIGQTVDYHLSVTAITPAVRAISLNFDGLVSGEVVVSGKILCSFPVSS